MHSDQAVLLAGEDVVFDVDWIPYKLAENPLGIGL